MTMDSIYGGAPETLAGKATDSSWTPACASMLQSAAWQSSGSDALGLRCTAAVLLP